MCRQFERIRWVKQNWIRREQVGADADPAWNTSDRYGEKRLAPPIRGCRLEPIPRPARNGQTGRHDGFPRRVGNDFADGPFHVRAQSAAKLLIVGKPCVVGSLHETCDETSSRS